MSLGLPSHLAPKTIGASFYRALHATAYTCLSVAFLLTVTFQSYDPALLLWPALVAVSVMAGMLVLSDLVRSTFFSVAYLAVGAASTYWIAAVFYSQSSSILGGDAFPLVLIKIALILVGGTGTGLVARICWTIAGYLVAEVAVAAATVIAGQKLVFDLTTFFSFMLIVAIFSVASLSRGPSRRTQPMLHRAVRDEKLAALRSGLEVTAAALMHDTVLSHLAAIADSTGDTLDALLARRIKRDLATIVGEEWLTAELPATDDRSSSGWKASRVLAAIEEAQQLGLDVDVSGDLAAVGRLPGEKAEALGLAVKQCLVNVAVHSGVMRAEVAVFGTESEISVMVIDAGCGFAEETTANDRLGLRQSVRQRIESVGGTVQIWSTIGRGSSIMIRLPNRSVAGVRVDDAAQPS